MHASIVDSSSMYVWYRVYVCYFVWCCMMIMLMTYNNRGNSCAVLLASSTPVARKHAQQKFSGFSDHSLHLLYIYVYIYVYKYLYYFYSIILLLLFLLWCMMYDACISISKLTSLLKLKLKALFYYLSIWLGFL
jgi:hypothetical protein